MIRTRLMLTPAARFAVMAVFLGAAPVCAADEPYVITIKDHRFSPEEVRVPAGKKVKLLVKNEDPSAEEFESYDLKREKVVGANSQISIFIGPLKPGRYAFFGEFNPKTANGVVIAEKDAS